MIFACVKGYSADINRDTFIKWSFISAMAVTGAYYNVPMGEVPKDLEKGHDSEIQYLLFDFITVAQAQDVEVPTYREVARKFI